MRRYLTVSYVCLSCNNHRLLLSRSARNKRHQRIWLCCRHYCTITTVRTLSKDHSINSRFHTAPPHNYSTYSHSTNSSASDQSAMLISPATTVHSDDNELLNHNSSSASSTNDEPCAKRRATHSSTTDKEPPTTPEHDASPGDESSRYRQRRARNNEAARKCRANRRLLVEQRQKRADELATENERLKQQVAMLKLELARLHEHAKQRTTHTGSLAHTPDDSS